MKRFAERLLKLPAWKFALAAAVLIAALAGAHAPAQPSSGSEAQQDAMLNCPQPGKWAISVWSGQDDADAEQAFATCGEGAMAAAYHIDPDTQMWSRWFAGRPEVSNVDTLDRLQGVLALGGTNAPAAPPSGPSAKPYLMDNCPQLGKWAIAIWEGPDGMDADEALDYCLVSLDAAYYIDPQTQDWLRWFRGRPEVSNLTTLNNLQGVIALVPPATTGLLPPPEEVGAISADGMAVVNYRNSTWYTGTIEFQGPTSQVVSIDCCTSPAPDILAPPGLCSTCDPWGSDRTLTTLPPGTYSVTLRFDDPYWGTHFAGEWTLKADKEYALCFCLDLAAVVPAGSS